MSDSADQADAKLAPVMEHFGERLNRVFAYFFFALEFDGDDDLRADPTHNARAWMLQTIENACIETALLALRDLDDILTPRTANTKPDDIRATDFRFTGSHMFLTKSEREKINKLIAHSTTVGSQARGSHWDILELATKGISQGLEFLRWVESEYGLTHFNLYSAALCIRLQTESHFAFITSEAEKGRATATSRTSKSSEDGEHGPAQSLGT